MTRPRPQILTLRYHLENLAQWREHPEPLGATESEDEDGPTIDPTIRFCHEGLCHVLGLAVGGPDLRIRVSATERRGARHLTLTGGSSGSGIGGKMPLGSTLPRIRALLTRVLGRPPVVGDTVWVEVLP